jgi:hypothetical protein
MNRNPNTDMIEYTIRIANPVRNKIRQEFDIRYGSKDPPEKEFQALFVYLSPDGQNVVRTHHKQWQKRHRIHQPKT